MSKQRRIVIHRSFACHSRVGERVEGSCPPHRASQRLRLVCGRNTRHEETNLDKDYMSRYGDGLAKELQQKQDQQQTFMVIREAESHRRDASVL